MTLEYTVDVKDWVTCSLLIQASVQQPIRWLPRVIKVASGVVFFSLFMYFFATIDNLPTRVAACAIVLSLGIAGHKSVRECLMEQWLHDHYSLPGNELLFGRRTIATSQTGFTIRGERFEAAYPWSALYSLEETADYVLVYIARVQAHPIPRGQVLDQAALQAFVAELRSHTPQARPSAA